MFSSSFPLSCLVLLSSACPFYDAETGSEEKAQSTIQLQLLINEIVKGKLTQQKPITIRLPQTATYHKLKKKILGKCYQLTSWAKVKKGSHSVQIFKHPPSPSNILEIEYGKTLLEQGIKNGDLLYAIVSNKNHEKNDNITFFIDHQYHDQIIMLVMKKTSHSWDESKEKQILTLANNVFRHLSEKDENNPEKNLLPNNTHLLYPPGIVNLHKHHRNEVNIYHEKPVLCNLLENGDMISIRNTPPEPVTITIKTTDGKKLKTIKDVFYTNTYAAHILEYITNRLHWNIEHRLFVAKEENHEAFYQPEALEEINVSTRLERSAYFANKSHIVVYVTWSTINDNELKEAKKQLPHNRNSPNTNAKQQTISIVINKLATSDTVRQQNPTLINVQPLETKDVHYIKVATKEILAHHHIRYKNNEKLENRLMMYVVGQYKKFKRIATEPRLDKTYPLLVNQRVELGDRIYVIIPSQKNPHQVSFFVRNEKSSKVALITTTIDRKATLSKQTKKINQIHQKIIRVFQLLEKEHKNKNNLPLWDEHVLKKTKLDLGGKRMAALQNGDLIELILHPAYYINITISNEDETSSVTLTSVPLHRQLSKLLEKAKEKADWLHEQVEDTLSLKVEKNGITVTKQLHLDQSLEEAGITENQVLYLTTNIVQEEKIKHQDNTFNNSLEGKNDNDYINDIVIEEPKNNNVLPPNPNAFNQQLPDIQPIQLNNFSNKSKDVEDGEIVKKNQNNRTYNSSLIPITALGLTVASWASKASNWFNNKENAQNTKEAVASEDNISTDA